MLARNAPILVATFLLASCSSEEASPTAALTPPTMQCTDIGSVKADRSPPELYSGVLSCIKRHNYENAAELRTLAGTYGFYDTLRVADPTAAQVLTALKFDLQQSTTAEEQQALIAATKELVEDPSDHGRLCQAIRNAGRPTYSADYMIAHGMQAFSAKPQAGDPSSFDPAAAWEKALAYPRCAEG